MNKIDVGVTFMKITTKKGINIHEERVISAMYKEYTHIEYMQVMRALEPKTPTKSEKREALQAINLIKEKNMRKTKRKDVHR